MNLRYLIEDQYCRDVGVLCEAFQHLKIKPVARPAVSSIHHHHNWKKDKKQSYASLVEQEQILVLLSMWLLKHTNDLKRMITIFLKNVCQTLKLQSVLWMLIFLRFRCSKKCDHNVPIWIILRSASLTVFHGSTSKDFSSWCLWTQGTNIEMSQAFYRRQTVNKNAREEHTFWLLIGWWVQEYPK